MDEDSAFFRGDFILSREDVALDRWQDESTEVFHIFRSSFGVLRLRKRLAYPATFIEVKGSVLCFGYGERQQAEMIISKPLLSVDERFFTEGEFLYGEADCRRQSVVLQRDAICAMPVFAIGYGDKLTVSNHCEDLYASVETVRIDTTSVVNHLMFDDNQRHLIEGVELLYDRVRLEWSVNGYAVHYPENGAIAKAPEEPGRAEHFKGVLESIFDTYWDRYEGIGFQLSGGLDSATAPGYYAAKGRSVVTATLGLPGVMGQRQRQKIQDMEQRFGIQNHTVMLDPATDFPLVDMVNEGRSHLVYEYNDLHLGATRRLADYLVKQGIATVFSGVGGDELCQNLPVDRILPEGAAQREERSQTATPIYTTEAFRQLHRNIRENAHLNRSRPIPTMAYSVILTHAGFNNTFIDRNIWPVAPLADPRLFLYSQSIPAWYRHNKNLLRMYQFARDFPPSIVSSTTTEDFSEFIHLSKPNLLPLIERLLSNSVLIEEGLVDRNTFIRHYQEVLSAPPDASDVRILGLIRLLVIENNLQSLRA